jgi:hypothetical protein
MDYNDYTTTPESAPFVQVEWEDITFVDNWNEDVEEFNTLTCSHFGFLLEKGPRKVVIAHGYDWDSGKWVSIHTFPEGATVVRETRSKLHWAKEEM